MSNVSFELGADGDYHLRADVAGLDVELQAFPAYEIDTQLAAAKEAAKTAQAPPVAAPEPAPAEPAPAEPAPEPAPEPAAEGEVLVSPSAEPAA